ncbi:MAG: hypothetical protein ACKVIY_16450 [Acidimicrobiales bacterium]|jgi:uncharacterized membrane protein YbaN (DUF454 family)
MTIDLTGTARPGALARAGWTTLGLLSVGVGGVGIIVPGLPTLGPLVREYRAGLGIPRRAKAAAVVMVIIGTAMTGLLVVLVAAPTKKAVLEAKKSKP